MDQEGLVQFVEEESGSGGKKLLAVLQFTVYVNLSRHHCFPQRLKLTHYLLERKYNLKKNVRNQTKFDRLADWISRN